MMVPKFDFINEDGKNNRTKRMYNIAKVIVEASKESKSNDSFIRKGYVLDVIRSQVKIDGNDKLGDARAHGDSCGGHGLCLEIEGIGSDSKILLNDTNIAKCMNFIADYDEKSKEFTFS